MHHVYGTNIIIPPVSKKENMTKGKASHIYGEQYKTMPYFGKLLIKMINLGFQHILMYQKYFQKKLCPYNDSFLI